jgi:hypothetical protein
VAAVLEAEDLARTSGSVPHKKGGLAICWRLVWRLRVLHC